MLRLHMTDYQIIKILLEEMEGQITHPRVTRGYGAGHPYWEKRSGKQILGDTPYSEEIEEKLNSETEKVKVSKAFKK